jgi:hypothetical protein
VGNPLHYQHKREEHGGFSPDDTHVALIVSGGALPGNVLGTMVTADVQTKQIAVSALNALGLDAALLQGAVIEGTQGLPGLGLPQNVSLYYVRNQPTQQVVGAFYDGSTTDNLNAYQVTVHWGDGSQASTNAILVRDTLNPNIVDVYARHKYTHVGTFNGKVKVVTPSNQVINDTFTATVTNGDPVHVPPTAVPAAAPPAAAATDPLQNIDRFVVIYQENWSFDSLYGLFPGANGLANASTTSLTQIDRQTGQPISTETTYNPAFKYDPATLQNPPPPLDNNDNIDTRFLTDPNNPNSPTAVNTLLPYDLSQFLTPSQTTGDVVHRFWPEQSQINHGAQNQYITWSDNHYLAVGTYRRLEDDL